MKRRSFFGLLAGLMCLPWPKPKHKFFDVPDGYEEFRIQSFKSVWLDDHDSPIAKNMHRKLIEANRRGVTKVLFTDAEKNHYAPRDRYVECVGAMYHADRNSWTMFHRYIGPGPEANAKV